MKNDNIYVAYKKYEMLQNYFVVPLDSDLLGIHKVGTLSGTIFVDKVHDIQSKYIVIP